MIQVQEHTGFKRVEDYSLATWLEQVQECIQDGYEFDMESNEGFPTQIGSVYTCLMKPKVQKVAPSASEEEKQEVPVSPEDEPVVQPKVDGRKKKV